MIVSKGILNDLMILSWPIWLFCDEHKNVIEHTDSEFSRNWTFPIHELVHADISEGQQSHIERITPNIKYFGTCPFASFTHAHHFEILKILLVFLVSLDDFDAFFIPVVGKSEKRLISTDERVHLSRGFHRYYSYKMIKCRLEVCHHISSSKSSRLSSSDASNSSSLKSPKFIFISG